MIEYDVSPSRFGEICCDESQLVDGLPALTRQDLTPAAAFRGSQVLQQRPKDRREMQIDFPREREDANLVTPVAEQSHSRQIAAASPRGCEFFNPTLLKQAEAFFRAMLRPRQSDSFLAVLPNSNEPATICRRDHRVSKQLQKLRKADRGDAGKTCAVLRMSLRTCRFSGIHQPPG